MINCISAFTSPIIQFGVADSESFRSKLIAQIYDEKEQTESVSYSNGGGGWQSPPQRKLPELVESTLSHIMSNVLTEDHAYTIGNLWYNVNTPQSFNHKHTHPLCDLAAVYYVKVPEGDCGRIEIENPNYFNQIKLLDAMNPKLKEDMLSFTSMWFPPVEGTGLIFPSHLMHRVSENNTTEDRISISWNITIS